MSLKLKLIHNNYTKSCCACLPKSNEKWSLYYEEFFIRVYTPFSALVFKLQTKYKSTQGVVNLCVYRNIILFVSVLMLLYTSTIKEQATNEFINFSLVIWPFLTFLQIVGRLYTYHKKLLFRLVYQNPWKSLIAKMISGKSKNTLLAIWYSFEYMVYSIWNIFT